ncbi:hypothetical protein QUF50_03470 [Thiotrichales bacterium HSG1]|nr:hypothetical protein [Thiotrichales bacterium HSG1]
MQVEEFEQIVDCIDKKQLVYIYESGIKPNIIRDCGWSPKGEKYLDVVRVNVRKT